MKSNPKNSNTEIDKRAKVWLPKARNHSETCLVIDGTNLAYMAYYAYSSLSYKGKSTSMMYGVPTYIKFVMSQYKAAKVIVCWDGKKDPIRIKALPEYKGHREQSKDRKDKKKRKAFLKELDRVRLLLHRLGIPQAYNTEIEGDDMVYWVTKKMQNLYRVVVVSGDKDMHQLINWDVTVYCPRNKTAFTPFAFIVDHQCEISQYVDYLCLVGDKSDDIPGYRGIGPARASSFFRVYKSIQEYLDNKNAEYSGLVDKQKLAEIYKRNRLMIDLKFFNEKYHSANDVTYFKEKRNPKFNEERFNLICSKYNLRTFLTETFKKPFKELHQ